MFSDLDEIISGQALRGKVVIVTGGAGADAGLGLTTTEYLLRAGAEVAVWDRNPVANETADAELREFGLSATFQEVDVTNLDQVKKAYEQVRKTLGPAHGLVNNAAVKMDFMSPGMGPRTREERFAAMPPFWELDPDRFLRLLTVNIFGPFLTSSVVAPEMVQRGVGSIVNVVTSPRTQRSPNHIPYGPSKAALETMTQAMATQLASRGIRCNAILPGGAARNRRGENDPSKSPYNCMALPILWLMIDESRDITGQVINGTDFVIEQ